MEWQNFQQEGDGGESGSGLCVKVMTDEQLDLLRNQIAVYASICEQLVQMHKICSAQHEFTGMRIGNPYYDPFVASGGLKITARQRWTPTSVQLQILERVYEECKGTPSKQKIQETAAELTQHGQISETNVYNWFQNRRARLKRKQSGSASNNAEPESETPVETGKKDLEGIQSFENSELGADNIYLQSPDIGIDQMINKMEIPGGYSFHWQMD